MRCVVLRRTGLMRRPVRTYPGGDWFEEVDSVCAFCLPGLPYRLCVDNADGKCNSLGLANKSVDR